MPADREPAPGVTRFTVPLALPSPDELNVHVIDTGAGSLIVDCGARGSEAALGAGLRAARAGDARVLITHAHVDHWGLATTLCPSVLAHPGVLPSFRFAAEGPPPAAVPPLGFELDELAGAFAGMRALISGVPDIEPLADGDRIGEWEVLWTPGHDPGHVCLFRSSDGVLICGDLLLPDYTPNIQPDPTGRDALADFLASLDRIAELPVTLVLPAHGAPYRDAERRARELQQHHAARLDTLRDAVHAGLRTLSELSAAAFGAHHDAPADRMLASMETYAHLDHLQRRGELDLEAAGTWVAA